MKKEETPIRAGVIQGGIISPTLFTIFINDLIKNLEEQGVTTYAYADDMAIQVRGKPAIKKVI